MTDEELNRRIHEDHDWRTLVDIGVIVLLFMVGLSALVVYLVTT